MPPLPPGPPPTSPPAVATATAPGTTGRSLPRLHPGRGGHGLLHRIAALSPEVAAAVEGLKAIVLLANGADGLGGSGAGGGTDGDDGNGGSPGTDGS